MSNLQKRALEKALHPQAQTTAENHITDFADALLLQSKTIAAIQGADEVQRTREHRARNHPCKLSKSETVVRAIHSCR